MATVWCIKCGVEHKAEVAVGQDEDGEPGCALHAVTRWPGAIVTAKAKLETAKKIAAPAANQPEKRAMTMGRTPKPAPLCRCGCGKQINIRYGTPDHPGAWKLYLDGHNTRGSQGMGKAKPAKRVKKPDGRLVDAVQTSAPRGGLDLAALKADLLRQLDAITLVQQLLDRSSAS